MNIVKYTLYICSILQSSSLLAMDPKQLFKTALQKDEATLKSIQKYQQKNCTNPDSALSHYARCEETKASIDVARLKMNVAFVECEHKAVLRHQIEMMLHEQILRIREIQKEHAYQRARRAQQARL